MSINGNKLKAGKFRDRYQFWIDSDEIVCNNNGFVSSAEVVIKNGVISKSACGRILCLLVMDSTTLFM